MHTTHIKGVGSCIRRRTHHYKTVRSLSISFLLLLILACSSFAEQQVEADTEIDDSESTMEAELEEAQPPLMPYGKSTLSSNMIVPTTNGGERHSVWADDFVLSANRIEILGDNQVIIHPLEISNRHLF